jgi:hypothetical protein
MMEPNTLRAEILRQVNDHQSTNPSSYIEDKALAAAIGIPLADVQRQIRILESTGLLDVAASFGPSYAVLLTPQGERALE